LKLPAKFEEKFKDTLERRKEIALSEYALTAYYFHPKYHEHYENHLAECKNQSKSISFETFKC
jgi:hypothetical protein